MSALPNDFEYDRAGDQLSLDLSQSPVATYNITCLPHVGSISHGLRAGDTSVLASFPKHGKSALAEMIGLDLSIEHGVLFLALEMGRPATRLRMAAKLARVSTRTLEKVGVDDVVRAEMNMRKLVVRSPRTGEPLWGLHTIAKLIEKANCPIVILDHLRWIDGWYEGGMSATKIAHELRRIAAATGVHIMQCAQLRPQDYGLKPSRWQVQDTTAVSQLTAFELLINRPYYGCGPKDNIVELIARSNRWGPSGTMHARWIGETQCMRHLSLEDFDSQMDCTCKERRKKAARE